MPLKYFIITFGCQMNRADSERIASLLEMNGYRPASKEKEADLIVVNSCSVRQSAVDRIHGLVPKFIELKTKNKNLNTVLTGCFMKSDARKLYRGFDFILKIDDLRGWKKMLGNKLSKSGINNYFEITPKYENKFSAYIPISNGCNNFCAYCVVPGTRGRLLCRSHKDIIKETENAVKNGAKEIWLLGQNVNDYESPAGKLINFSKLLKLVNDIPGSFWIRFTSSNPKNFSEELIEAMLECGKITPYLNLPIQSGDDKILKKMNRPYTAKQYELLIKKIRKKIPGICLSTDIIVGFPGETEKQFQNTKKLMQRIKFDMAYIAKYSPRKGTRAFCLKDDVLPPKKAKRLQILTDILRKTALENNKKYVGKTVEVLSDSREKGLIFGKTREYKTIGLKGKAPVGIFIKAKITKALTWGLEGKIIQN